MKLMEQVRRTLRVKHYALATERGYCQWIVRFIHFHGIKHPNTMGAAEVEQFLTHLATTDKVAASTQNQALGAQTAGAVGRTQEHPTKPKAA